MPSSSKDEWEKNTLGPSLSRFPPRQDQFVTDSVILCPPTNLVTIGLIAAASMLSCQS